MSDQSAKNPGQGAYEAFLAEDGYHHVESWDELEPAAQARWEESAGAGARQKRLIAEHGMPRHLTGPGAALRLIGKRAEVHPHDAAAFAYRDHASAQAWAAANLEHHGHPSLGIAVGGDEVIGVLDLRPALIRLGARLTGPALPDNWRPRRRRRRHPRQPRALR